MRRSYLPPSRRSLCSNHAGNERLSGLGIRPAGFSPDVDNPAPLPAAGVTLPSATNRSPAQAALRYAVIVSVALAEVLAVFALYGYIGDKLHARWNSNYTLEIFERHLITGLLPVPLAFLLWLRVLERDGRLPLQFSLPMALLSAAGFTALFSLAAHPYLMLASLAFAVVTALFIFVPIAPWAQRVLRQPKLACVALIAATASMNFYWLMEHFTLAKALLFAAGKTASFLLSVFGIPIFMVQSIEYPLAYDLYSSHFKIILVPFCCGFEGIFMFFFVLSAVLMLYWQRFKTRRLWPLYGMGIVVVFLINALRIAILFSIGHLANTPGMPGWVQSLRGAPFELFHSWLGWVMYQIAFALFAVWLCRSGSKKSNG
jgi:exosortase/archaeosortase family protein